MLRWPTSLTINPVDDTLHILDNNVVLKVTHDNKVLMVAGRPLHCPSTGGPPSSSTTENTQSLAVNTVLEYPQHISFSPVGDLYIVESNGKNINQIRRVITAGRIEHYAGAVSPCNCRRDDCNCGGSGVKEDLAISFQLDTPTAITVTPDDVLHIADMGNLRVYSIVTAEPTPDKLGQFEFVNNAAHELYVFNRYGQHISTRNADTASVLYNFSYNVNSPYGKLMKVETT